MAFAVYHVAKGSGGGSGLGHHIDRTPGKEHTYKHADPERIDRNIHISPDGFEGLSLQQAVSKRIEDGYKGKRAIRKDSVKYLTHMLTGSHEQMKEIFSDKDKAREWIQVNANFIAEEFGQKNIVRFTIHLDEKTPHIHCVTVPLTRDGRLSAKELVGNNKNLQDLQTRYAEKMQPFGLERGRANPNIKHRDTIEWYKDVGEDLKKREEVKKELEDKVSVLRSELGSVSAKSIWNDLRPKKKDNRINELLEKNAELEKRNADNQKSILEIYKMSENQKEMLKGKMSENQELKNKIRILERNDKEQGKSRGRNM